MHEMPAGVEAGAAQQHRILEPPELLTGHPIDARHDHPRNAREAARIVHAPGGPHAGRAIDERRPASGQNLLRPLEGAPTKIGVADGVHHQFVPWQLQIEVDEVGVQRMEGESPVVDPELRRDVAAARGHQQEDRRARPTPR